MLNEIRAMIQSRKITLNIDPLLQNRIAPKYRKTIQQFSFNLYDLICAIGISKAQTGSKANKFAIAADFLKSVFQIKQTN